MVRKTVGITAFIIGVAMLAGSFYIKSKVEEGREQIADAEKKVGAGKGLFSVTPYTKDLGNALAHGAEKKIKAGTAEADRYERIAGMLQIGGIIFIVIGVGTLLIRKRK